MRATIHLVRHGRSALQHDGQWMPHSGVRAYEHAYNLAGILADDAPPSTLCALARAADVVAASTLTRAIESASRLVPGRAPVTSPLLGELALEPPRWVPLRLPIEVWDAFSFVQWSYRLWRVADHEYVRRADEAARWLAEQAAGRRTVLAVTHGGFRRILHARLLVRGWRAAPGERSHANWSTWTYTRAG